MDDVEGTTFDRWDDQRDRSHQLAWATLLDDLQALCDRSESLSARAATLVLAARCTPSEAQATRAQVAHRAAPGGRAPDTAMAMMDGVAESVAESVADAESMSGEWRLVVAPADIDGADALALVREVFARPGDVLIDLRGTNLLTAAGARALYDIHRHAELTGHVAALVGPAQLVRRVLHITGLDEIIPDVGTGPGAFDDPAGETLH